MIIKTLVENTSISEAFKSQHGLSLYVETKNHKLLFDLGKDTLFLENAKKMNIDIEDIDLVVISHGHYDHGGGLRVFLENNSIAKVYVHKRAFEKHYSERPNGITGSIGLDEQFKNHPQVVSVEEYLCIDEELELFSGVRGRRFFSTANKVLLMEEEGRITQDTFAHEQNLIITENGKTLMIAGCAHNGIVNIIERFIEVKGTYPDHVIGGFHLYSPSRHESEEPSLVRKIGNDLNKTGSRYHTCHCTGLEAFGLLQEVMKENIEYLATGRVLEI